MRQKSELSNSGVYFIYCNSSDKIYIASATNIRKRFGVDKATLKKGSHCNPRLQADWNKFGEENFEFGVLKFCNNEEKDEIRNKYLIEYKDYIYLMGRNRDTYFMDVPRTAGIYMIENLITNQKYIGGTSNIRRRFRQHYKMLNTKTHFNYNLQNSWDECSFNDFEFKLIESCNEEKIKEREQYYIDFYDASNIEFGFNIAPFSDSTKGVVKTEEFKQKISEATKLAMANPEVREKLSIAQKKRFSNPEEKARMREILDPIVKSKEFANEHRELAKLRWKNPEYRKKQIETRKELYKNSLVKEKMKEISNNMWNDPKKYKSTLEKRSNISKEQVEKILSLKDSGLTYRQIGAQVGCRREIVGRICRGENKFALLN